MNDEVNVPDEFRRLVFESDEGFARDPSAASASVLRRMLADYAEKNAARPETARSLAVFAASVLTLFPKNDPSVDSLIDVVGDEGLKDLMRRLRAARGKM